MIRVSKNKEVLSLNGSLVQNVVGKLPFSLPKVILIDLKFILR